MKNLNTYAKYTANVFVAESTERYLKGDTILMTTKYGQEHECIVYNCVLQKNGFFYYSIVRADGFNSQERAKKKSEKLVNASKNAENKSTEYWKSKENEINLAMPESLGFFEYKLEEAKLKHEMLKGGRLPREHSFSLTYAKKAVNDATDKLKTAQKLWA